MKKYHIVWKDVGSFFREVTARETDSPGLPGIKNGIRLVEPNDNLAAAYLKKAEEATEAMYSVTFPGWPIDRGAAIDQREVGRLVTRGASH